MTLDQLRVFVAVAEREHMTRAAEALNLVQSAVSHAVGLIETEFGVALFDRVGRRIELTPAGRVFLEEARSVLMRAEAARDRMRDLVGLAGGSLSIHASQAIAGYWLPSRLKRFRARYPRVALRLSIGNSDAVARSVSGGSVDLGLVEGEIGDPDLVATVVARDQLVLVVAPDHPWARLADVAPAMLPDTEWVLREVGSGTRSVFEAALATLSVSPSALPIAMELPSNEAVRAAVEAGTGASALSASVAASGIEAGLLHRVPFDLPPRPFAAVRHRDRTLSPGAAAFLQMLQEADQSGSPARPADSALRRCFT